MISAIFPTLFLLRRLLLRVRQPGAAFEVILNISQERSIHPPNMAHWLPFHRLVVVVLAWGERDLQLSGYLLIHRPHKEHHDPCICAACSRVPALTSCEVTSLGRQSSTSTNSSEMLGSGTISAIWRAAAGALGCPAPSGSQREDAIFKNSYIQVIHIVIRRLPPTPTRFLNLTSCSFCVTNWAA